jgi:hypothetical protein
MTQSDRRDVVTAIGLGTLLGDVLMVLALRGLDAIGAGIGDNYESPGLRTAELLSAASAVVLLFGFVLSLDGTWTWFRGAAVAIGLALLLAGLASAL